VTAWHGSQELKDRIVARMHQHRADDAIVQGVYQHLDIALPLGYRGCAIGCLLDRQPVESITGSRCIGCGEPECDGCISDPDDGWHEEVERQFGIPRFVAERIDNVFESFEGHARAADFAVAAVEAIPVGADLTGVQDGWQSWVETTTDAECYDSSTKRAAKLIELIAAAPVAVSDAH
jgi:hypothetical protein